MKKTTVLTFLSGLMLLGSVVIAPVPALADVTNVPSVATSNQTSVSEMKIDFHLENPLGSDTGDLNTFIANVLDAVVLLLSPVVVIMMLYSGLLFVLARGNVEEVGKAKNALLYTMIGAAIVLGAKGLALVIQNTVGCLAGGAC